MLPSVIAPTSKTKSALWTWGKFFGTERKNSYYYISNKLILCCTNVYSYVYHTQYYCDCVCVCARARVCVCVWVCVCVCVYILSPWKKDIPEGADQRSCVVNISWVLSAKFHHLRIWKCHISPPKTKTPAEPLLERKRYDMCSAKRWYILI